MNRNSALIWIPLAILFAVGIVIWYASHDEGRSVNANTAGNNAHDASLAPATQDHRSTLPAAGVSATSVGGSATLEKPAASEENRAVRVMHQFTGEGRTLQLTLRNHATSPLTIDRNRSGDPVRALSFLDADGQRVPTIPPSFPTSGTITIEPGGSRRFDYHLNIFSPPLKPGKYTINVSFVPADPIIWIVPEPEAEGDAMKRTP